jgi:three-Cys-motif partner protein
MVEHSFGGPWTERKLKCLRDYLITYRKIFSVNRRAQYFHPWYVDAFAGTGSRSAAVADMPLLDIYDDADTRAYQNGSARIALDLASPFDRYLFIERARTRARELRRAITSEFSSLDNRCEIRSGEANAEIRKWCGERDWLKERAVVFLDPYGMQVEWQTVTILAGTKDVDLWYLFPGIARLLPRDGNIPEPWKKRLDVLLGTEAWQARFFQTVRQPGLFGDTENVECRANDATVGDFIRERLATCFGKKVANTSFSGTQKPARSIIFVSRRRTRRERGRH